MQYIIIGNSAAGISACEAIRAVDKTSQITIISDEDYPAYSRCLLSYYLAGTISEGELLFKDVDFYKKNNIKPILGKSVVKVLPKEKSITLNDKTKIKYDKLLIATGSRANLTESTGIEKEGVFAFRTVSDAKNILNRLKNVKTTCILGGGLIGLKVAYGLHAHNIKIKVIVKSPQLLSQMIDKDAASLFQNRIQKHGIDILTGVEATEVLGKKEVEAVSLDDGKKIDCQLIIIGKGVSPNVDLASDCGIVIDKGIVVNQYQQTNIEDIFAAGDVAQARDLVTGESTINALWPHAVEQGRIAGLNMSGQKTIYDGSMAMNSVEFFDLPVISMGITRYKSPSIFEELIRYEPQKELYKKIVIKDNIVVGTILVNCINNAGVYRALIKKKLDISSLKDILLEDDFGFAKISPLINKNKDRFTQEEYQEIILTFKQ